MEQNWWESENASASEATVAEFEAFLKSIVEQRKKKEELQAQLKIEQEKYEELQAKALVYMKQLGKDSYPSSFGTVSVVKTRSVALPKTPEQKQEFFNYLKSKGLFDNMISVNSQTLNSWYRQEHEIAVEEKRVSDFKVPGLSEPSVYETIRITKRG